MSTLDDALIAAHLHGDGAALVQLYRQAADETADLDAACFYLTHAYVFALETDHPLADDIHGRLAREGRV